MPVSVALVKELENVPPDLRRVLIAILEEMERQRAQWEESVTKTEFNELKEIVREISKNVAELTEAQKKSEARLERLEKAIEELTEAQKSFEKQTEENFNRVWQAINELTEAQKRSEERLTRLEKTVEELAEAQKRTEARLEAFEKQTEENFNRVWQAINELTEAQKRTEEEIARLTRRMESFEERLEGISNSVGYSLENKAYKALPRLLRERYGLEVEGRLIRRYFEVGRKEIQVNIFGCARRNGRELLVLGECKVRPSRKEIERFERYARKIAEEEGKEAFLVFVAHNFPPKIERALQEKGLAYFWSYELE